MFYHRYVREGAYVPWAKRFGEACEVPDFHTADKRYLTEIVDSLGSRLKPVKALALSGIGVVVFGAALILMIRRRQKLISTSKS
ncbi:hypothetical protein [Pseudomonas sp. B329]|uniref:hypothetical protein n=1 Tax=Pseudomonas sp. B329 TaxID=1553459 RepID=UPI002004D37D|nr:hypothetical protein [Pseudomonas sp. B329]MCK3866133.1 hypothetical protein [Pseudomonas sp. B329]